MQDVKNIAVMSLYYYPGKHSYINAALCMYEHIGQQFEQFEQFLELFIITISYFEVFAVS